MTNLIDSINARIEAQVAALKYIDENWGQLDYYGPNMPVKWPCCLSDADTVIWRNLGNKQQEGTAVITLQVANLKLTNTSQKAPATQRNQVRRVLDIIQDIHQALHGWAPVPGASLLYRKGQQRVKRDDGIQQYQLIYECNVKGGYDTGKGKSIDPLTGLEVERG